eukprot:576964-Alexandrium_andersonii.AAC.1
MADTTPSKRPRVGPCEASVAKAPPASKSPMQLLSAAKEAYSKSKTEAQAHNVLTIVWLKLNGMKASSGAGVEPSVG